ncbi:MAG TPA: hypothetical protein VFZ34_15925 [Blastocatellia bacterium]|nr:hypothetical protein [Blastocatellia bacterium]
MTVIVVFVGLFGGGSPGPPGVLFHPNPFFTADFFTPPRLQQGTPEEITKSG